MFVQVAPTPTPSPPAFPAIHVPLPMGVFVPLGLGLLAVAVLSAVARNMKPKRRKRPSGARPPARPRARRVPTPLPAWTPEPIPADYDLALNEPGCHLRAQAAPLLLGAEGEERAGAVLKEAFAARPGFYAIHSIPVKATGTDIDHLVICPGGVFTLNTKNHAQPATVWCAGSNYQVNGHPVHHVHESRHEAEKASRLLSAAVGRPVQVFGVIVVVGATLTVKEHPNGSYVLALADLAPWLFNLPPKLSPGDIEAIFTAARQPTTWLPELGTATTASKVPG